MYNNMTAQMASPRIPDGWSVVRKMAIDHPTNSGIGGALCKNDATGRYALIAAGVVASCPQDWARDHDETNVRSIRATTAMSQAKFAAYLDIPKRTIENWEAGLRKCPDYVLSLIRYRIEHDPTWRA